MGANLHSHAARDSRFSGRHSSTPDKGTIAILGFAVAAHTASQALARTPTRPSRVTRDATPLYDCHGDTRRDRSRHPTQPNDEPSSSRHATSAGFDLRLWTRISVLVLICAGLGAVIIGPWLWLAIGIAIAMSRRGQRLLFGPRIHRQASTNLTRRYDSTKSR